MATTINSYSVGLGMDASGYIDGAKISRSETRQLIKDIEGARTPTEQFAREQDRLTDALNKGAISQEVYSRLLEKKRSSLLGAADATDAHSNGISSLTSNLVSGASALYVFSAGYHAVSTGIHVAIDAGVAFVSYLRETQNQIDDTIDSANKLGVTFNEIGGLRFAAKMGGGVDAATVDDSIKKMLVNTAKAVDGDEGVRDAFARLGLNAADMMRLDPVQAFAKVAESMKGIDSQAEKLKLTMDIFGKSGTELVSTLDQGAESILTAYNFHQKWNSLTESQTEAVGKNNDQWDNIATVVDGLSAKLAAEFAPAMLVVAESALGLANNTKDVNSTMTDVVDTTVYLSGVLKDSLEVMTAMASAAAVIASFGAIDATLGLDAAFDVNSGERALQALYDKRLELEKASQDNAEERDKKRQAMLASEIEMKETAADKAAQSEIERDLAKADRERELADKKKRDFLELSLKEANKFFEDEKKKDEARRKEVAKGPGAGMEVGSAEAAKYMADQINAAIGAAVVPEKANPTQEQLTAEAARQSIILEEANRKSDEQTRRLDELIELQRKNGWRQI
jgi:hypothetical protein